MKEPSTTRYCIYCGHEFKPWRRDQRACSVSCHNKVIRRPPGKYRLHWLGDVTGGGGRPFSVLCGDTEIRGFLMTAKNWILWPKDGTGRDIVRLSPATRQRVSMSLRRQINDRTKDEKTAVNAAAPETPPAEVKKIFLRSYRVTRCCEARTKAVDRDTFICTACGKVYRYDLDWASLKYAEEEIPIDSIKLPS